MKFAVSKYLIHHFPPGHHNLPSGNIKRTGYPKRGIYDFEEFVFFGLYSTMPSLGFASCKRNLSPWLPRFASKSAGISTRC